MNLKESPKSHVSWLLVCQVSFVASATLSAVAFIISSTLLRPTSDDYWFGASATNGFVGGFLDFYLNESGGAVSLALVVLLVGLPAAFLPFTLASAIPFLLTAMTVSGATLSLVGANLRLRLRTYFSLGLFFFVLWLIHIWVGVVLTGETSFLKIAEFLIHWQTTNIGYIMVPALFVIVYVLWEQATRLQVLGRLTLSIVLGLATGLSGLTFGASAMLFLAFIGLFHIRHSRYRGLDYFFWALGALLGILADLLSPGTQNRSDSYRDGWGMAVRELIQETPRGLTKWLEYSISVPALFVLICGIVIGLLFLDTRKDDSQLRPLIRHSVGLLIFSLILSVVSTAASVFVYEASWHTLTPRLFLFLGLVLLGVYLSSLIQKFNATKRIDLFVKQSVLTVSFILIIGLLASSVHEALTSIHDRQIVWDKGESIKINGAEDRESPRIAFYWEIIEEFRSGR